MKILLIDDILQNLEKLESEIIEQIENTEIITCHHSEDAEKLAEKNLPDMIITDFLMPELDGIEVCEKIRNNKTTKDIPIIILSGSKVDTNCRIECLNAGADVFLFKPIDAAELIAQIKAMYRIKSAEDELRKQNLDLEKKVEERNKTLQKKIEYIQKTEQYYRSLFENAFDAIILFDPETEKFIDVNNQACKLYGYSKDELLKTSLSNLTKDVDRGKKQIRKTLSAGFQKKFETVHIHKDGREIYLESNSTIINYEGRKAILAVMRDITERKIANQAQKESEEKYRTIFESTGTATMLVNDKNEILNFNPEFKKLSFYSENDVINKNWMDFVYKDDLPSLQRLFKIKKLKPNLLPNKIETRLIDKKGRIRHTIMTVGKVLNTDLNVVSLLDTTDQRIAEKKLKESEEKFRLIADNSPNMIYINVNRKIVYANRICEKIMGYKRSELYDSSFDLMQLIHPDQHQVVKDNLNSHLHGKEVSNYELTIITKDKKNINTIISTKLIPYDGQQAILGIITDITEIKKKDKEINKLGSF